MSGPAAWWWIACGAAVVTAVASCAAAVVVRGTTAVPAAAWAAAAALALAVETGMRAVGLLADPAAAAAARLGVTALGVCPAISLLGAKRPQHGVWQFIVGALAVVLCMPAASATLVRPGEMPDVGPLGRWFLLGLILVGWLNFAATSRGAAAALVAGGQAVLARGCLPVAAAVADASPAVLDAIGATLVAAGAVVAGIRSFAGGRRLPVGPTAGIDRPFRGLRETLGAAWALRIAERFNATADDRGWPCRLRFDGLHPPAVADGPWRADAERAFAALARRFATADWLRRQTAVDEADGPAG